MTHTTPTITTTATAIASRPYLRRRARNHHRLWWMAVAATSAIFVSGSMRLPPMVCEALNAPSKSPVSFYSLFGMFGGNNDKNNNRITIKLFDPENDRALKLLRDCRRTAFDTSKKKFLNSERDFIAAQSVVDGKNLCAVAIDGKGDVVGSADLTPNDGGTNVVTNVFVRPDLRGKGIGKRLMVEGIEIVLADELPTRNLVEAGNKAVLSLDVYTRNTAAIKLYQKLGYEPSSPIHAGTLALANALNSNLLVVLSKTVSIKSEE